MIDVKLHKNLISSNKAFELDISFRVEKGQFISICGNSGAGKTTILRLIAGLDDNYSGSIKIQDSVWYDSAKGVNLPPQKRRVGMVFQDYALFPNMTVRENLEFALATKLLGKDKQRNLLAEQITARQKEMIRDGQALAAQKERALAAEKKSADLAALQRKRGVGGA